MGHSPEQGRDERSTGFPARKKRRMQSPAPEDNRHMIVNPRGYNLDDEVVGRSRTDYLSPLLLDYKAPEESGYVLDCKNGYVKDKQSGTIATDVAEINFDYPLKKIDGMVYLAVGLLFLLDPTLIDKGSQVDEEIFYIKVNQPYAVLPKRKSDPRPSLPEPEWNLPPEHERRDRGHVRARDHKRRNVQHYR